MPRNVSESKDTKKWPTDTNFLAFASTGHKVEIAGANTPLKPLVRFLNNFRGMFLG